MQILYRFTHCIIHSKQFDIKFYLGLWFHVYSHNVSAQQNNCNIFAIGKLSRVRGPTRKHETRRCFIGNKAPNQLPFMVLILDFLEEKRLYISFLSTWQLQIRGKTTNQYITDNFVGSCHVGECHKIQIKFRSTKIKSTLLAVVPLTIS